MAVDINILSRAQYEETLRNDVGHADFELQTVKLSKCLGDLLGFMGAYYKLDMQAIHRVSRNKFSRSYFIKTLPYDNRIYRDECIRKSFFKKESGIYKDILPNIQRYSQKILFPKAYFIRIDLIALEDFSLPAKRLRQFSLQTVYKIKHFHLFLNHLAELHAASLAWETKENFNIGNRFGNILYEFLLAKNNVWYVTGIKSVVFLAEKHPKFQYPKALEFIKNKLYDTLINVQDLLKPSETLRNVFCHRDSWNRNIFWELNDADEPIGCRIVDFQQSRYNPPAIDVLYFLYSNIDNRENRTLLLNDLLAYYHQTLRYYLKRLDLPEDLITKAEFDEGCRRALLPVLTLRAICEPLMKMPKEWCQLVREIEPQVFNFYMNSDRRDMFRRISFFDTSYMDKVLLPIQELLEYFELQPQ